MLSIILLYAFLNEHSLAEKCSRGFTGPPKCPEHVKQTDQQTRAGLGALEQQLGLPSLPEPRVLVPQGGDSSLLLSCGSTGCALRLLSASWGPWAGSPGARG